MRHAGYFLSFLCLVSSFISPELYAKVLGLPGDYNKSAIPKNSLWLSLACAACLGALVVETSLQINRSLRMLFQHQPKMLHACLAWLLMPTLLLLYVVWAGVWRWLDIIVSLIFIIMCLVAYGVAKAISRVIFRLKEVLWPYYALRPILVFTCYLIIFLILLTINPEL